LVCSFDDFICSPNQMTIHHPPVSYCPRLTTALVFGAGRGPLSFTGACRSSSSTAIFARLLYDNTACCCCCCCRCSAGGCTCIPPTDDAPGGRSFTSQSSSPSISSPAWAIAPLPQPPFFGPDPNCGGGKLIGGRPPKPDVRFMAELAVEFSTPPLPPKSSSSSPSTRTSRPASRLLVAARLRVDSDFWAA
ncbi:hypothetical protein Vretimale_7590, partial [Volvox reticuliferus]